MEPFIVGVDITDINQLYGRDREIKTLISCAKRKGNAGIIGARRFGKTCLMKSMVSYLQAEESIGAYPLYFDVKTQCGVKNDTVAVYRTMASLLASKMCLDSLLPEGSFNITRRCTLEVSSDELDMRVQMEGWHPEYQKQALFSLASVLSNKNKYLLLLLDEIDYLLLEAFDNPSDFSRVRGAATDKASNIKFWIASTSSWSAICTNVGSPELNCGLENVTLSTLSYDDFLNMWKYECGNIDNTSVRKSFEDVAKDVYEKTGGIPYYSKFVASYMLNNNSSNLPKYEIIRDYLCEIVNNRFVSDSERSSLYLLAKEAKQFSDTIPDGVTGLKIKGLVSIDSMTHYYLPIGYLADYLNACNHDREMVDNDAIEQKELDELVSHISRLRSNVNKKIGSPKKIFSPSDEDPGEFEVLRIICTSKPKLDSFANSVCKLYYEGSDRGNSLPNGYLRRDFSNIVRALRNIGDHRDCIPTSMTTERLYCLVNNGLHPYTVDHYKNIQLTVLNLFRQELISMTTNRLVETNNTSTGIRKRLVENQNFEGKIVLFSSCKKIQCENYPYPLRIEDCNDDEIYEGDIVIFTAKSRPNDRGNGNPYWFATNVRLKKE